MAADPTVHVVAVGHCDSYGSEEYNLALGEKRSNSVKSYVSKSGAAATQIEILSMGQYGSTPDVKKDSPEAKHDRRVDLVKIPTGVTLPSGPPASTPTDAGAAPAAAATKPAGEGS
jgi:outer membrane protein OmpA-like peptidoglycan-associated protein